MLLKYVVFIKHKNHMLNHYWLYIEQRNKNISKLSSLYCFILKHKDQKTTCVNIVDSALNKINEDKWKNSAMCNLYIKSEKNYKLKK